MDKTTQKGLAPLFIDLAIATGEVSAALAKVAETQAKIAASLESNGHGAQLVMAEVIEPPEWAPPLPTPPPSRGRNAAPLDVDAREAAAADRSRGWQQDPRTPHAPLWADVRRAIEDLIRGGLCREVIALSCGVGTSTISKWYTGRSCPRRKQIERLNRLLRSRSHDAVPDGPALPRKVAPQKG
jgi:hypothetical protein